MNRICDDIDWSLTTWEGARREQLRRAAALTLRERMQSLEDMAEIAERFRRMRETARSAKAPYASAVVPASETTVERQSVTRSDARDE